MTKRNEFRNYGSEKEEFFEWLDLHTNEWFKGNVRFYESSWNELRQKDLFDCCSFELPRYASLAKRPLLYRLS